MPVLTARPDGWSHDITMYMFSLYCVTECVLVVIKSSVAEIFDNSTVAVGSKLFREVF